MSEENQATEAKNNGVIDPKYREKYGKEGSVGDEIANALKEFTTVDGKVSAEKLAEVASANGIEKDYSHLNVGMQRMTIGNILRGKHQRGEAVKIGKTKIDGAPQSEAA